MNDAEIYQKAVAIEENKAMAKLVQLVLDYTGLPDVETVILEYEDLEWTEIWDSLASEGCSPEECRRVANAIRDIIQLEGSE